MFVRRLVFCPNGDKLQNGENHISLYLQIAETETFLAPWEVNAEFKLFVHNQLEDKFLAVQGNLSAISFVLSSNERSHIRNWSGRNDE